jgi:hypothetical protein
LLIFLLVIVLVGVALSAFRRLKHPGDELDFSRAATGEGERGHA